MVRPTPPRYWRASSQRSEFARKSHYIDTQAGHKKFGRFGLEKAAFSIRIL